MLRVVVVVVLHIVFFLSFTIWPLLWCYFYSLHIYIVERLNDDGMHMNFHWLSSLMFDWSQIRIIAYRIFDEQMYFAWINAIFFLRKDFILRHFPHSCIQIIKVFFMKWDNMCTQWTLTIVFNLYRLHTCNLQLRTSASFEVNKLNKNAKRSQSIHVLNETRWIKLMNDK